jgi:hypothetical protein
MLKNIKLTASLIFGFALIFVASAMIVYALFEAFQVDRLALHLGYALVVCISLFSILQVISFMRNALVRFKGNEKLVSRRPFLLAQIFFGTTLMLASAIMGFLAIAQIIASVDDIFYVAAYTVITAFFCFSGYLGYSLIPIARRYLKDMHST